MLQIVGISAFFVAAGFFNTFGMAVDTIFLCFRKFSALFAYDMM